MRKVMKDLWMEIDGNTITLGMTKSFLEDSGEITFVNFQVREGSEVKNGDILVSLETVKSVVEVRSPVTGKISKLNEDVSENPDLINDDPEKTYLVKIEVEEDEVMKIGEG